MKVISGGQTGIDQIALTIAKAHGIETGGWAPHNWQTEAGPAKEALIRFGLREHQKRGYPPRTESNIKDSDFTVLFTEKIGPGSALTIRMCKKHGKQCLICPTVEQVMKLVTSSTIINFAGTRGSRLTQSSRIRFEQAISDIMSAIVQCI